MNVLAVAVELAATLCQAVDDVRIQVRVSVTKYTDTGTGVCYKLYGPTNVYTDSIQQDLKPI
jgi:hypothetical protein